MGACSTKDIDSQIQIKKTSKSPTSLHQQTNIFCSLHNVLAPNPSNEVRYWQYVSERSKGLLCVSEKQWPCQHKCANCTHTDRETIPSTLYQKHQNHSSRVINWDNVMISTKEPLPCFLLDLVPTLAIARQLVAQGAQCVVQRTGVSAYVIECQARDDLLYAFLKGTIVSFEELSLVLRLANLLAHTSSRHSVWKDPLVREFFLLQLTPLLIECIVDLLHQTAQVPFVVSILILAYVPIDVQTWHTKLYLSMLYPLLRSNLANDKLQEMYRRLH